MRGKRPPQKREPKTRVNDDIRAPEIRVVDEDGEQLGIMHPKEAMKLAKEKQLDLVEIAPKATPPVCKIIDYGKLRYEQQKRDKLQRKNQQTQQMKEVRLHPRTDTHDVEFKLRHAKEFLDAGHKVKFSVLFRGREMAHQDVGRDLLEGILESLEEEAKVDQGIRMDGRNMSMIVSPDTKKK